jgi:hypothetical protein
MVDPPVRNDWIYSSRIVNKAGHDLSTATLKRVCPTLGQGLPGPGPGGGGVAKHVTAAPGQGPRGTDPLFGCVTKIGRTYHTLITYQPASRYWTIQWLELGVYLAAALALVGFSVWWIRRRLV